MIENKRGGNARTFRLKVTTKVQVLCANNPKRTGLLVVNNGTAVVYLLSAQNLTADDGIPIAVDGSYNNSEGTSAYWIVAASGTQDVRVEVDSVKGKPALG